ncbi:discoidin domain-containing protein [Algibacter pacificus]|uniref:discoidin domain-containing protein n=1 Tax=Algibacter pacificus TaxID=2599389 RepID=UPI0011C96644|nr:discoidin domain-containing protein [Algibacter pacificus]
MRIILLICFLTIMPNVIFSQNVDEETPKNAKPNNTNIEGSWTLDFSDEFNGTSVDDKKWQIDNSTNSRAARPNIGIYDWKWKPENVSVENGNLILKVFKTNSSSMTNGSINSASKYLTQYGYFETRIKVGDASKGTHTAFWLQGPNMSNVDGTANDGAEIDVFETAWTGDYTKSVIHIDGYGTNHQANTKQYNTPGIHSGFHTWGFHWTESFMDIYYDGVFKVRYSDTKWVVKTLEYLWLSNGASFGLTGDQYFKDYPVGYLTETQVDYIRVWKEQTATDIDETLLKQDHWKLVMVDSEDTEGQGNPAINAFDDNPNTFWHTEWKTNQPTPPHEIQIDLGERAKISAFKYLPRQDNNTNGNITQYEFYASNTTSNWGTPIASGSFTGDYTLKTVNFNKTIECKYIKLVALASKDNKPFTNIAELYLKGSYPPQLSKDNWQLLMVDSEDNQGTGNPATNAFDNNSNSFWFTDWANDKPSHPHEIQINLGDIAQIEALKYLPRQDGKTNGNITQYQFYTSMDGVNWGAPIVSGTLNGDSSLKTIYLDHVTECQYIKLVALADVNNSPFTNIAELFINGSYNHQLSLNTPIETNIIIYPNPFKNKLYIKLNKPNSYYNWTIYSINGLLLKKDIIPLHSTYLEINTSHMSAGSYLLKLNGTTKTTTKLLIKN